jgi:nicotinamide phosphoribosyltransferase
MNKLNGYQTEDGSFVNYGNPRDLSLPAMLLSDFYKLSHRLMYPKGTEKVYSTWTPRASRMRGVDEVVVFGNQAFIKKYLIDFFNEYFFKRPKNVVCGEYSRIVKHTLGIQKPDVSHIEALHDLGYLPLKIKGLPEGTVVPLRTPVLTVENTHPQFFWLTNYIETLASCELWPTYTAATIAREYRKILDAAAMRTVGNTDFVQFQGHDFSMRGMMGLFAGMLTGMGHLTQFVGTDTIPSIPSAEYYYNANVEKELVGTSVAATEHSIQCAYGDDMEYLLNMISVVHPSGIVSIVSDGYDFWDVIGRVVPALKNEIMARDGKVVIRPDSGDPVLIVCGDPNGKTELERKGAVEALYDIFGGTVTEKGFKLLDSHIGLIYGDAITLRRAEEIVTRLEAKGFASINVVFGIGSYTYQYNTRDTFGFALKSTLCVINGKEKQIFKDPKTDDGVKKSQKGKVVVYKDPGSGKIVYKDGLGLRDTVRIDGAHGSVDLDMLQTIFEDGKLLNEVSLSEVRARLKG